MTQDITKFARKCKECGKGMNEGYVINGGVAHYCSDACMHKHVSAEEFEELYDDGDGDSYWTEWDADDCDDDEEEEVVSPTILAIREAVTPENIKAYRDTIDKWVFAYDTLDAHSIPVSERNISILETFLEQAA